MRWYKIGFVKRGYIVIIAISISLISHRVFAQEGKHNEPKKLSQELSPIKESHTKMVEALRVIRERTNEDNVWIGDRYARILRTCLKSVEKDCNNIDEAEPELTIFRDNDALQIKGYLEENQVKREYERKLLLHFRLARAEMHLGNNQKALEHIQKANKMFKRLEIKTNKNNTLDLINFRFAMIYFRIGETENCCLMHNEESCLFPIQGKGVHIRKGGSKKAIEYFSKVLKSAGPKSSIYMSSYWLLNIAYMTLGNYPEGVPAEFLINPEIFEKETGFPRFKNISASLNIDTISLSGGVIADDFNNDNYIDLMVTSFSPFDEIKLFINDGNGAFMDKSNESGLGGIFGGLNMVQGDYDNDGFADVLVLRGAWLGKGGRYPNSLLHNNGDGTFHDVTFMAGLAEVNYPTQAGAFADFDNDGDLDIYIGNESSNQLKAPSQLFVNNGDGTFMDVAQKSGVTNDQYTKGVVWGDFNKDGLMDLYVSNAIGANRLYQNVGNGVFNDIAQEARVDDNRLNFSAWFWDFNNDGALDIFTSTYGFNTVDLAQFYMNKGKPYNPHCRIGTLYKGRHGTNDFEDITIQQGLGFPSAIMGANIGDLDNDGFLDFYGGTGYPGFDQLMPNVMLKNEGGQGFVDVTIPGGFGHLQKGHAVVFADFDNDGDQDIFEQMGGAFASDSFADAYYENPGFGNNWIKLKLIGVESNRSAIGARIRLDFTDNGQPRSVYRDVNSGGSFGANPLMQMIGVRQAVVIERIEIFWPKTGKTQVFENIPVNSTIKIIEGQSPYVVL